MAGRQLTTSWALMAGYKADNIKVVSLGSILCSLMVPFSYLSEGSSAIFVLSYFNLVGIFALICLLSDHLTARQQARPFRHMTGKFNFLCISGYSAIFIGHAVANKFGVGYGIGGGRQSIAAILVISFAFLLQSGRVRLGKPHLMPFCGLLIGLLLASLDVLYYFAPSLYPYLTAMYANFNWEVAAAQKSFTFQISRLSGLRDIGYFLALFAVCRIYYRKGWKNANYMMLFLSVILVLLGGYRSYLLAVLIIMALLFLKRKWFPVMALFIVVMAFLSMVNMRALPESVQRAASFLPGDWDPEIAMSAESGVSWREMNIALFMTYRFWDQPWLGCGIKGTGGEVGIEEKENWDYVDQQQLHSGFFSALDHVGIIGLVFLILATIRACRNCLYLISHDKLLAPWMLWVILFYVSIQSWFWITGFFADQFMQISVCMVVLELIRAEVEAQKQLAADFSASLAARASA